MQKNFKLIPLLGSIIAHGLLFLFLLKEKNLPLKSNQDIKFKVSFAAGSLPDPRLTKDKKPKFSKIREQKKISSAKTQTIYPEKSSTENKEFKDEPRLPDRLPKLINSVEIASLLKKYYPEDMRQIQKEGKVKLAITIEASGTISKIEIIQSAGASFDQAAKKVVRLMKFRPAMKGSQAMRIRVSKVIRFRF